MSNQNKINKEPNFHPNLIKTGLAIGILALAAHVLTQPLDANPRVNHAKTQVTHAAGALINQFTPGRNDSERAHNDIPVSPQQGRLPK